MINKTPSRKLIGSWIPETSLSQTSFILGSTEVIKRKTHNLIQTIIINWG
ncbi:MAG: hypothetical protein ACTS4T_01370 [Candidatus Hodgkinia cicadicola]